MLRRTVLALVALAPLVAATVTDPVQNDAGSGGDAPDALWELESCFAPFGRTTGWLQGLLVPVDDPADVYCVVLPDAAADRSVLFAVDPPASADFALRVILPSYEQVDVDARGAGGAEVFLQGSADAGPYIFVVEDLTLPRVLEDGTYSSQTTSRTSVEYDLRADCWPYC